MTLRAFLSKASRVGNATLFQSPRLIEFRQQLVQHKVFIGYLYLAVTLLGSSPLFVWCSWLLWKISTLIRQTLPATQPVPEDVATLLNRLRHQQHFYLGASFLFLATGLFALRRTIREYRKLHKPVGFEILPPKK